MRDKEVSALFREQSEARRRKRRKLRNSTRRNVVSAIRRVSSHRNVAHPRASRSRERKRDTKLTARSAAFKSRGLQRA